MALIHSSFNTYDEPYLPLGLKGIPHERLRLNFK